MNNKNPSSNDRVFEQIMGINVISTTVDLLLAGVKAFVSHNSKFDKRSPALGGRNRKFCILTPNSELVLMAQQNERLKEALNAADFPVPDAVGLRYAYRFLFGKDLQIIPGRKLFMDLVNLANKEGWKVFLLGGLDDEAAITSSKLKNKYQKLRITCMRGPVLDDDAKPLTESDEKLEKDAIEEINNFAPELLFVAFGNPRQEIWVYDHYLKLNIGGAMTVGGAFRYAAGLSRLPPKWMADTGLEWLWRLITEPKRIGRIFNAVIVFPAKLLLYRINHSCSRFWRTRA